MHAAAAALTAALSILYSPHDGSGQARWELSCGPAGGSLPRAAQACTRLAAITGNPFLPVPDNVGCTDIYGGPETARVVGTFRGRRVWATFRQTNGCEIARWGRLSFLFAGS
jgi:hypothetical protein